jgi:glycosyltransferase involved in cell wall biosynthesis
MVLRVAALQCALVPFAALVSFRLGGTDGVSIESAKWRSALEGLGFDVVTVAGEGPVDHLLPGLAMGADRPPERGAVERALADADVVVVENLCSLPLNPAAAELVAQVCAGRPAILHHHDLSWQRPHLGSGPPPDDPAWRHVTINELSRRELAAHGVEATTIYNCFDTATPHGERTGTRAALEVDANERLFLQPTRALARKNVAGGLALAHELGASYWLLGPAEDGYGPELDRLLANTPGRVIYGPPASDRDLRAANAYAACDLVLLPSTWEGFGNPAIESAVHRRPLCIGPYPVARELSGFGFQWLPLDEPDGVKRWFRSPDPAVLQHNWEVADAHFSLRQLPGRLAGVLSTLPISF